MSFSSNHIDLEDVEVGTDAAQAAVKDDAASVTTAPSVDSGDSSPSPPTTAAATAAKSSRRSWVGGAVALLVVAAVVIGAVMGTRSTPTTTTSTSASASASTTTSTTTTTTTTDYDDTTTTTTTTTPPIFPQALTVEQILALPKPFPDAQLPTFNKDVLQPYESREALEADLTAAAQFIVNGMVLQNIWRQVQYGDAGMNSSNYEGGDDDAVAQEQAAQQAGVGATVASAQTAVANKQKVQKASLTNNQEKDADEADMVKNDETYVYAAYGDYLVVWDRQGNMVTSEHMPGPTPVETTGGNGGNGDDDFLYAPTAYIEGIQLTETHVMVAVGGHSNYDAQQVAYGANATYIRIFTKPTSESNKLTLVSTLSLDGYYQASRYLDASDSIQIVSGGDVNTYEAFVEPLELYHYPWVTQESYIEAATQKAQTTLIPKFVKRVSDFLIQSNKGELPSMMKIHNWLTDAQQKQQQTQQPVIYEDYYGYFDEAVRSFIMVTSIRAQDLPTAFTKQALPTSTTALLAPVAYGSPYMTADTIVVTVENYQWQPENLRSSETLFLTVLKVADDGSSTTLHSIGSVDGTLPSPMGIDLQGTDLRVATSLQKWSPLDTVWEVCGDATYYYDSCMDDTNWQPCFDTAMACRNVVKTGCPYQFSCADTEAEAADPSSTENYVVVLDASQEGIMAELGRVRIGEPHEVITSVRFGETFSYATTFDQRDPFYVLKLQAGQAPEVTGTLKLDGMSNYLHPLNDDATLLVGIGQNVSGEGLNQMISGIMVSVFNVSNPSKPVIVATEPLVKDETVDATTNVQWDAKSVQYQNGILVIPVSTYPVYATTDDFAAIDWMMMEGTNGDFMNTEQVTAAPTEATTTTKQGGKDEASTNTNGYFEGFFVLKVDGWGVEEVLRINHVNPDGSGSSNSGCHYCNGYLPSQRSLLYDDGSLMTMYEHSVVSTDITSGQQLWAMNVTLKGVAMDCCV